MLPLLERELVDNKGYVTKQDLVDYYAIGQRIRKYRKALGYSQEYLAEQVDISIPHMSHIETGSTKLSLPVLVFLAGSLHVSVDELLGRYGFVKDGPVWRCADNGDFTVAVFCHFGISMAILGYLTDVSPMVLWQHTMCLPSSLTEVVTEERIKGEVIFRMTKLGDLTHLEASGEVRSTAGLFPEVYTGFDSTNPAKNGTLK